MTEAQDRPRRLCPRCQRMAHYHHYAKHVANAWVFCVKCKRHVEHDLLADHEQECALSNIPSAIGLKVLKPQPPRLPRVRDRTVPVVVDPIEALLTALDDGVLVTLTPASRWITDWPIQVGGGSNLQAVIRQAIESGLATDYRIGVANPTLVPASSHSASPPPCGFYGWTDRRKALRLALSGSQPTCPGCLAVAVAGNDVHEL